LFINLLIIVFFFSQLYIYLKSNLDKPIIIEIIEKSQILKNEKKLSKSLAIILIYDLLFGHAKNFKNAPVFQKIMNKNKVIYSKFFNKIFKALFFKILK